MVRILLLLMCSCFVVKENFSTQNIDNLKETEKTILRELNLAREGCINGIYNFCDHGYDDFYRMSPYLVKLDFNDFMKSYDDTVYIVSLSLDKDSIGDDLKNVHFSWELDSVFDEKTSELNKVKVFTSKSYKKKVKKEIKSNKLNVKFDGYFRYYLYKVRFKCIYGGKRDLILPDVKEQGQYFKSCHVYFIKDVLDIKPISKNEF